MTLNDIEAPITSWTETEIATTVPSGATAGLVPVVIHTSDGRDSNAVTFTVIIIVPKLPDLYIGDIYILGDDPDIPNIQNNDEDVPYKPNRLKISATYGNKENAAWAENVVIIFTINGVGSKEKSLGTLPDGRYNIRISFLCSPQIPRNFPIFPPADVLK